MTDICMVCKKPGRPNWASGCSELTLCNECGKSFLALANARTTEAKAASRTSTFGPRLPPCPSGSTLEEVHSHWKTVLAPCLLEDLLLEVEGRRLRVIEAEFYFTSPGHPDPYTHCHELQKKHMAWYFHRTGSGYKGGSYKGLDVTIGDGSSAGGLLIRSLLDVQTREVICGPSLVVDHILKLLHCSTIPVLVDTVLKGDLSACRNPRFKLITAADGEQPEFLYFSPRVGLHLNKGGVSERLQAAYVFRDYRAISDPSLVTKGRHLLVGACCRLGVPPEVIGWTARLPPAFGAQHGKAYLDALNGLRGSMDDVRKRVSDSAVTVAMGVVDRIFGVLHTNGSAKQPKTILVYGGAKVPSSASAGGAGKMKAAKTVAEKVAVKMTASEKAQRNLKSTSSIAMPISASGSMDRAATSCSLKELREMCRYYHLPVAGTKADLRLRLDLDG